MDFAYPADYKVKIKGNEKRHKYLELAWELKKKTMEYDGDSDTNCYWWTRNNPQRLGKETGRVGNRGTSRYHPNHTSIVKISQNIEKSPGDLRRLAVTQTPVKDYQLTLVWKTRKE